MKKTLGIKRLHLHASITAEKYGGVAPWVTVMHKTVFFRNCELHPNTKRNEEDRFCIDCLSSFCSHCLPAHSRHNHVKIRRYVYSDVINRHDLCKLFNCSGIQTYQTNKTKVLFLKQRNQQQQQQISSKGYYSCIICDRILQDNSLFCSIACKVAAIFGDRHMEQMRIDNFDKYKNNKKKVLNSFIKHEDFKERNQKRRRRKGRPLRAPIS